VNLQISFNGNPDASVVLIQPVDEHDLSFLENEMAEIRRLSEQDFCLVTAKVESWNRDLSPWKAPAVFGKEDFGDGAEETLEEILELCTDKEKTYIIGGYSLAALFSLWAVLRTDVFAAAAAASPSVWFPGFLDFLSQNEVLCRKIYLSLGNKEEKTRNAVMATVGDCIRRTHEVEYHNRDKHTATSSNDWQHGFLC
jgi:hypothetical protein